MVIPSTKIMPGLISCKNKVIIYALDKFLPDSTPFSTEAELLVLDKSEGINSNSVSFSRDSISSFSAEIIILDGALDNDALSMLFVGDF